MGLLNMSTLMLQLGGAWPLEEGESKPKKIFYKMYGNFLIISFVVFNVFLSLGFIRLILKKESFGRLSNSLSVLITLLLMILNITIFNQKKVAYLCQDIKIYEKNYLLNAKDPEISVIYEAILKKSKILNTFTLVTSFFGTLSLIGVSLLWVHNAGSNFWESDAPFMFELYVPFDRQKYYGLVIIANIFIACLGTIFYIAVQTTFYGLFMYGNLRFQILQLKFKKFSTYNEEDSFEGLKMLKTEHYDAIK
ncbi:hypothetical protein ABEB36_012655 [Hypothenemus hampei]|uniref:Uncharacterized protein n=1 Tax=Hypothenemus hampei TaxID=57062 RepID=A0ABD1EEQ7_HYPHA